LLPPSSTLLRVLAFRLFFRPSFILHTGQSADSSLLSQPFNFVLTHIRRHLIISHSRHLSICILNSGRSGWRSWGSPRTQATAASWIDQSQTAVWRLLKQ
jgi:hypothetical protein